MAMNKPLQTALILLLAGTSGLNAQMYMSQEGHLLDANNRIGSYGRNTSVPLDVLVPRGDLYMTGNISGGARFQGVVPYRSNMEFGGTLGSGSLGNFHRDSVGVDNLSTHQLAPSPYLDPSRSVTTTYGGNVVNTSQAFGQLVSPVGAGMGSMQRVNPYQREDLMVRPMSRSYSPLNASNNNLPQLDMFSGYTPRRAPALPNTSGQQPVSGIPYQMPKLRPDQTDPALATNPTEASPTSTANDPAMLTPFEEEFQVGPLDRQAQAPQPSQATSEASSEGQAASTSTATPTLKGRPAGAPLNRATATPGPSKSSARPPELTSIQLQEQLAQQSFNRGRELMQRKHYYRAADQFDMAALYAGGDPLVYAAKAQALFGAGEYMSSAYFLSQMLLYTDTLKGLGAEVTGLWNDPETVQKRMVDMIGWYEKSQKPMLLLLKGYVEYCQGQAEQAKATLINAQQILPDDPVVKKMLTLVGGPASG